VSPISCYNWEHGTLTLPTAAAPVVKAAVRNANNLLHDDLYALATTFWALNQTRSPKYYRAALSAAYENGELGKHDNENAHDLHWVLLDLADHPRKATHADIDRAVPRASNRTTYFQLGEASITFAGRRVTWSSGSNNHQVERARKHPVARAFFDALDRVKWTRGTGGRLVGNDEYNEESRQEGGGGNYVTEEWPKIRIPGGRTIGTRGFPSYRW
jgi:hypothetical protein